MRVTRNIYLFFRKRMYPGIIHTSGKCRRRRIKILHLFRCKSQITHIFCKLYRLFYRTSRMRGHKIRNRILLPAGGSIRFLILIQKLLVDFMGRFSHIMKYLIGNMFRCNTKLSADMMLYKNQQKNRTLVCHHIIKTNSGTDEYFFDTGEFPELSKQRNIICMIYGKIAARFRKKTLPVLTDTFGQLLLTGRLSKIRCRSTHIMDISLKIRNFCHFFCFPQNRIVASCLKDPSLMEGQGTEITASKAPSVARQTEFYFFQCRYSSSGIIHRMPCIPVRKIIDIIHLLLT